MAKEVKKKSVSIKNRKASFEYHITDRFICGIVLQGSEIKSVRAGQANISDAYCIVDNGRVIVKNLHISEFKNAGYAQHIPIHDRFLLLHKSEIKKIVNKLKDRGFTLIPTEMFIAESGYAKLEIGLARGKKSFDKRDDLKTKDIAREMERYQD